MSKTSQIGGLTLVFGLAIMCYNNFTKELISPKALAELPRIEICDYHIETFEIVYDTLYRKVGINFKPVAFPSSDKYNRPEPYLLNDYKSDHYPTKEELLPLIVPYERDGEILMITKITRLPKTCRKVKMPPLPNR